MVSFLIPTFNREKFIVPCLRSVLNQSFQDFRIIVYDDGSTDKTVDLIESLCDDRIEIHKGISNLGIAAARNKLLELLRSPYGCWMDSDDLIHVKKLELQMEWLREHPRHLVATSGQMFDEGEQPPLDGIINPFPTHIMYYSDIRFRKYKYSCASILFPRECQKIKFLEELQLGRTDLLWNMEIALSRPIALLDTPSLYLAERHFERFGRTYLRPENKERKKLEDQIYLNCMQKLDSRYSLL